MRTDTERHQLLIKSVILSYIQDETKNGADGYKVLSDFLEAAKFCCMKDGAVGCSLNEEQNSHARAIKLLMTKLLHDGAEADKIGDYIVEYTESLLKTYQGEYPEQS